MTLSQYNKSRVVSDWGRKQQVVDQINMSFSEKGGWQLQYTYDDDEKKMHFFVCQSAKSVS